MTISQSFETFLANIKVDNSEKFQFGIKKLQRNRIKLSLILK